MQVVRLSRHSLKAIHQFAQRDIPIYLPNDVASREHLTSTEVVTWLSRSFPELAPHQYMLEALRASMMQDLLRAMLNNEQPGSKKEKPGWLTRLHFGLLAILGTIVAVCDGFDSISSILSLFSHVPASVVCLAGLFFSVLSVAIFYGFDLITISSNLGVKLHQSPRLLDKLLAESSVIKQLQKRLDSIYVDMNTVAELHEMHDLVAMLQERYAALQNARQSYQAALNRRSLQIAKRVTSAIAGILFFGGGYLAGQTLATTIAGIFFSTTAAIFWPIAMASVLVGVAAVCIYWYVERPGLENLVGRWFGLDKEKIDAFTDAESIRKVTQSLTTLQRKLTQKIELLQALSVKPKEAVVVPEPSLLPAPVNPGVLHQLGVFSSKSVQENSAAVTEVTNALSVGS